MSSGSVRKTTPFLQRHRLGLVPACGFFWKKEEEELACTPRGYILMSIETPHPTTRSQTMKTTAKHQAANEIIQAVSKATGTGNGRHNPELVRALITISQHLGGHSGTTTDEVLETINAALIKGATR
jgi:hypothetical protein